MISIIICSVNKILLKQLELNIAASIGLNHEIIAINNTEVNEGICTVYNKAGALAQYPVLLFLHEDVLFDTPNWGPLILKHFTNLGVGMIGLAGGDTKGIVPSSWSMVSRSKEMNLIQHHRSGTIGKHIFSSESGREAVAKNVVMLDGFFLCVRRSVFDEFKFDEVNLNGFHGYDIDYSLQVFRKYDVRVVFDILVHHYSVGIPNRSWIESAITINRKWRKQFPLSVYPLSKEEINIYHWKSLQVFLYNLFRLRYPYHQIIYYYLLYSFTKYFTVRRFLSMGKYVLQSIYKRPGEVINGEAVNSFSNGMKIINYN
ncbi:MAG: glycosyltransferase [Ferruginibacter sp.]